MRPILFLLFIGLQRKGARRIEPLRGAPEAQSNRGECPVLRCPWKRAHFECSFVACHLQDRNGINPHSVLPAINSGSDTEVPSDLGDIYDRLPRDSTLCQEPLLLSRAEQTVILRELQRQLKFLSPEAVRSAYQDLVRIDHSSSGYVAFQDLKVILSKNTVRFSDAEESCS